MKRSTIMLTGGGTLGPVTPVLAIMEAWKARDPQARFVWVGTPKGPERQLIEGEGIPFHALATPKFDRFVTWRWLLIPLRLGISLVQALWLLLRYRPSWVVSAGGYVAVPLVWLGWITRTKTLVHQLDVPALLTNRILAPFAAVVTASWPAAEAQFPKKTVHVVGSPVRGIPSHVHNRSDLAHAFDLDPSRKTILVMGGGGGSVAINTLMEPVAKTLAESVNVIHVTGPGKNHYRTTHPFDGYRAYELLTDNMLAALQLADVVVARAGMGTITETAALKKPTIFIPLPNSPQESNTRELQLANAAKILDQKTLTSEHLLTMIQSMLQDDGGYGRRLHECMPTEGVASHIVELMWMHRSS